MDDEHSTDDDGDSVGDDGDGTGNANADSDAVCDPNLQTDMFQNQVGVSRFFVVHHIEATTELVDSTKFIVCTLAWPDTGCWNFCIVRIGMEMARRMIYVCRVRLVSCQQKKSGACICNVCAMTNGG